jgi:hypothetical protein
VPERARRRPFFVSGGRMGRAETVTLLPISRYSEIMRIFAPHFNQMNGAKAPLSGGCDDIWSQEDREDLAFVIAQAEELIAIQLGFWPAPKWITSERIALGLTGVRSDWQNAEVKTKWGYVQAFGTKTLTLVEADSPVTYTDEDGDEYGREEVAKVGDPSLLYSFLSADCEICNVALFFRVGDGAYDAADPRWEIRPIVADNDGDLLTVTAESSLFVKPELWKKTPVEDPTYWKLDFDLDNLVEAVDVYCAGIDYETPVTIKWDGVCSCTSPCSHYTQAACAYVTDWEQGFFVARPATWNGSQHVSAEPSYGYRPESLVVNYLAGYPLDERTCRINPNLERAIVSLTNVLLPEPPCGFCDLAARRWKRDRMRVDPITVEAAGMPWGMYEQGALEAWRLVRPFIRGRGGKMGWS